MTSNARRACGLSRGGRSGSRGSRATACATWRNGIAKNKKKNRVKLRNQEKKKGAYPVPGVDWAVVAGELPDPTVVGAPEAAVEPKETEVVLAETQLEDADEIVNVIKKKFARMINITSTYGRVGWKKEQIVPLYRCCHGGQQPEKFLQ